MNNAASADSVRRLPIAPTFIGFLLLLLLSLIVSLGIGQEPIPPPAILQSLGHLLLPKTIAATDKTSDAIVSYRLPRVLLAALVGASLAVAGAALQGLLGNPLADPYTTGVSSGSALGAGIALSLGIGAQWHGLALPFFALLGAAAAMILVFGLARVGGRLSTTAFLLAGVGVGAFFWSGMLLTLSYAKTADREILNWLMGRLQDADTTQLGLLAPVLLIVTLFLTATGRSLDAFTFGEETARSVGVPVEGYKAVVLGGAALLTAVTVSVAGIIGFVGLIVPHIARSLVGPPHRALIPLSALLGASLTMLADLMARTLIYQHELPVGIVTALIGAPVFALLLRGQMGR